MQTYFSFDLNPYP